MNTKLILSAVFLGPLLIGNSVYAEFLNALAVRGSTQEDAPALELYLTQEAYDGHGEPSKPYLHIEVAWGDWDRLVGKDLELIPLSRHNGDAQKHVVRAELGRERSEPVWLTGTLRLKDVEVDRLVEGSYSFVDPDAHQWVGTFKARWMAGRRNRG